MPQPIQPSLSFSLSCVKSSPSTPSNLGVYCLTSSIPFTVFFYFHVQEDYKLLLQSFRKGVTNYTVTSLLMGCLLDIPLRALDRSEQDKDMAERRGSHDHPKLTRDKPLSVTERRRHWCRSFEHPQAFPQSPLPLCSCVRIWTSPANRHFHDLLMACSFLFKLK